MNSLETAVPGEKTICEKIVDTLADAEGTNPTELTPPLYEVIDPEALETLFVNSQAIGKVIFNYEGYEVRVFADGDISVESHGT